MKILIADDSAIVRAILEQNLKKNDPDFEIVASVSTGRKAIEFAKNSQVDLAILDYDMPEMNGFDAADVFVSKLKIPTIVLSEKSSDFIKIYELGAISIQKPNVKEFNNTFFGKLTEKIKSSVRGISKSTKKTTIKSNAINERLKGFKIVCIGASTGGPTAVASVLKGLGKNFSLPIIYSQHIEIGADKKMAEWLDETCTNIHIKLANDGEEATAGTVYMAPADKHLVIDFVKPNGNPILKISNDPPERFLRPAVNKMFVSASDNYKSSCLAVLLTGMGRDGADGCKKIVDTGGYTVVEDKSTCAVFGMPAAAIEVGGAKEILPRDKIPSRILELIAL